MPLEKDISHRTDDEIASDVMTRQGDALERYRLSDGTDISRKTVDQITAAQRKLSPRFPSFDEAFERRTVRRENFAARVLMFCIGVGLIYGIGWDSVGYVIAGIGVAAFVAMCIGTGNRQYKRSGSIPQRGDRGRPF